MMPYPSWSPWTEDSAPHEDAWVGEIHGQMGPSTVPWSPKPGVVVCCREQTEVTS